MAENEIEFEVQPRFTGDIGYRCQVAGITPTHDNANRVGTDIKVGGVPEVLGAFCYDISTLPSGATILYSWFTMRTFGNSEAQSGIGRLHVGLAQKDGKWNVTPFGFNVGTGPTEYEFTDELPQPTLSDSDTIIPGVMYLDEWCGIFSWTTAFFRDADAPHYVGDSNAINAPGFVGGAAVTQRIISGFIDGGTDNRLTEFIVAWLAAGEGDRICIVFDPWFVSFFQRDNIPIIWSDAPIPIAEIEPKLHIHYEENPPTITSPEGPLTGEINVLYSHLVTATDPTGQAITFSLIAPLDGITIVDTGPGTATILWTPTTDGDFLITVRVADEDNFRDSQAWTVTVPSLLPLGPHGEVGGAIKVRPVTAGADVTGAVVAGKIAAVATVTGDTVTAVTVSGKSDVFPTVNGTLELVPGEQRHVRSSIVTPRQETITRVFMRQEPPVPTSFGITDRLALTTIPVPTTRIFGPFPDTGLLTMSNAADLSNAAWETGDWTIQLNIVVPDPLFFIAITVRRVDVAGNSLELQAISPNQFATSGLHTFGPFSYSWAPGNADDRLRVSMFLTNGFSPAVVGIELGSADTWVDNPLSGWVGAPGGVGGMLKIQPLVAGKLSAVQGG